jgi:hypothetical protein
MQAASLQAMDASCKLDIPFNGQIQSPFKDAPFDKQIVNQSTPNRFVIMTTRVLTFYCLCHPDACFFEGK